MERLAPAHRSEPAIERYEAAVVRLHEDPAVSERGRELDELPRLVRPDGAERRLEAEALVPVAAADVEAEGRPPDRVARGASRHDLVRAELDRGGAVHVLAGLPAGVPEDGGRAGAQDDERR